MLAIQRLSNRFRPAVAEHSGRTGPIGLEVGHDAVRLCQLEARSDGRFNVRDECQVVFDVPRKQLIEEPLRFRRLIKKALRQRRFRGRDVVAAMPPDLVRFLPISYQSEGANTDHAVLKALAGRIEGDISRFVVDYLPVRQQTEGKNQLALAALVPHDEVIRFLDLMTSAGLRPQVLDIGPAALKRLLSLLYDEEDSAAETILVLNAGESRSYVSVISGRRLLFDQVVEFGERSLLQEFCDALDMDEQTVVRLINAHGLQATGTSDGDVKIPTMLREVMRRALVSLVDEVRRILVFAASETRGRPVERVFVFGSLARLKGVDSVLAELLDVTARNEASSIEDYFVTGGTDPSARMNLPEMAVTAGLALRGLVVHE